MGRIVFALSASLDKALANRVSCQLIASRYRQTDRSARRELYTYGRYNVCKLSFGPQ
jgi:hypothetical protein